MIGLYNRYNTAKRLKYLWEQWLGTEDRIKEDRIMSEINTLTNYAYAKNYHHYWRKWSRIRPILA